MRGHRTGCQHRLKSIALHGNPAPPPLFPAGGSAWRQQRLNWMQGRVQAPILTNKCLSLPNLTDVALPGKVPHEAGTSRRGTLELGLEKQVLILAKVSDMRYHVHSRERLHFSVLPESLSASCGDVHGVLSACSAPLAADASPPTLVMVVKRSEQFPTSLQRN